MFRALRQPRYAALGVLMLVVAIVCVACGVWQVYRFESKRDDNDHLRTNARIAATSVGSLLPLVGAGKAPGREAIEFRQVRVRGTYDESGQTLVRSRTDGDDTGFLIVTPLLTSGPTLLVVRGFVAQPSSGAIPTPAAPPGGPVTVLARTQVPESRNDQFANLQDAQVQSINPTQQQARLGGTLYNGFVELESGQPGTSGLRALPRPDLSNPAGGALEPQHFAYVIQWFLFALLALAAPFAMIRAESKRQDTGDFDTAPDLESIPGPDAGSDPEETRAVKLADRYGRPIR